MCARMSARRIINHWSVFFGLMIATGAVSADEATLKSGLIIRGTSFPVPGLNERTSRQNSADPFLLIDDGVRRYFVPNRFTQVEQEASLSGTPEFELRRQPRSRSLTPEIIGSSVQTPFDEFGRREVILTIKGGKTATIIQQITRLRPEISIVEGINYDWTHGIDTRTIAPEQLNHLLHSSARKDSLDDLKAIVRFYIDAERYQEASEELRKLAEAFPDQEKWAGQQLPLVMEQSARKGMREVQRLRQAGQHQLALVVARAAQKAPPNTLSVDVLRETDEIIAADAAAREKRDRVLMLLDEYEAQLEPETAKKVKPMRAALGDELNAFENIDRLDPFLRVIDDETLTPAQKLALAYSGWVLGASYAEVELDVAINLFQARFLVLEYLRIKDDPFQAKHIADQLTELEGVTVERLASMLPLLPYVLEERPPVPGEPREYTIPSGGEQPATYAVALPLEYNPSHRYPLLVALRRSGQSLTDVLKWWAGDNHEPGLAMRRGYIVIAPEFIDENANDYDYNVPGHQKVLAAIADARKRFAVDSDRIYIAGHQIGGDACYDIALAHPDIFAGAAPFLARPDNYSKRTSGNGTMLSWYIVSGERDRDTLDRNATVINNIVRKPPELMKYGADVVYCEYKSRGFESYFEELPRLFDWFETRRRLTLTQARDWNVDIMRATDDRYFWVEGKGLPSKLVQPVVWEKPKTIPNAMTVSSKVTPGNSVYVKGPYSSVRVWLSPEIINFEERLTVSAGSGSKFNNFIRPSATDLLEDFRIRGDRQRLYWAMLEF